MTTTTENAQPKLWPSWCAKAIQSIDDEMQTIRSEFQKIDAHVVGLRDQAKAALIRAGLMTVETINCKYVGVHFENRYGQGLVPAEVIQLISDIFGHGFSIAALQDPTCMEMPPKDHPRNTKGVAFNRSLTTSSGGILPNFVEDPRYMSVTCGHTNAGLRCIAEEMPCTDERFTKDGRLNTGVLRIRDPTYANAVAQGIQWNVCLWPAEDAWPWLPELLQESGNASQQIARCESRIEVMLKVMEIARRNMDLHQDPMWSNVTIQAARGGSAFKDELPGLVSFVCHLSGGLQNPIFLFELRDFARQLAVVRTRKRESDL